MSEATSDLNPPADPDGRGADARRDERATQAATDPSTAREATAALTGAGPAPSEATVAATVEATVAATVESTVAATVESTVAGATVAGPVPAEDLGARTTEPDPAWRPARPDVGPSAADAAGVVAGFEILSELGRGGMGVVYRARQTALDRTVALKMILAGAHAGPEQLTRFTAEAQAIAQLRHPHIIQVHDIGACGGLPYFSLEFIEGGTLADRIGGRPMPPRAAAEMLRKLALGMHAAHSKGIIHRDLKPANVLLTAEGEPKITDFGLAKRLEGDSNQARTGAVMGTPSYMAPEQAGGHIREVGPLSDQYALGAILYEMLTGRPPFQGPTPLETLPLARTQEAVPPARLQPGIPRDLETIALRCLQKDPRRRYEDCDALAEDLRRFLDGEPILARPASAAERFWRWCLRNRGVAALAAAVVLLMLATTVTATVAALLLNQRKQALDQALETVRAERNRAEEQRKQADDARASAEDQKRRAQEVAKLAFDQGDFALNSLRYLSILANQRLVAIPGTQPVREELLRTAERDLGEASGRFERVARLAGEYHVLNEAMIDQTMIGIYIRLGQVFAEAGNFEQAGAYYRKMFARAEAYLAAHPREPAARDGMARAAIVMGRYLMLQASREGEAEAMLRRGLAIRRELAAEDPSPGRRRELARAIGALARLYLNRDARRARPLDEEELALREGLPESEAGELEARRELAGLYEMLGQLHDKLGDPKRGGDYLERCLELRRNLSEENRGSPSSGITTDRDVLLTYNRYGLRAQLEQKDLRKARAYYERALAGFQELYDADPNNALIEGDLGTTRYYVGATCWDLGEKAAAREHFRACLALRRKQVEENRSNKLKALRINLMLALARCGEHAEAAGIADALMSDGSRDADDCYFAATGYALCAGAVAPDKAAKDRTGPETALIRRYADAAFGALRAALSAGWRNAGDVAVDPDLDPIRPDPRFDPMLEEFRRAEAAPRRAG